MKKQRIWCGINMAAISMCMAMMNPADVWAGYESLGGPGLTEGQYVAIAEEAADIYVSMDSYDILRTAAAGECFPILQDEGGGWMEVKVGDTVGYLSAEKADVQKTEVFENSPEAKAAAEAAAAQVQAADSSSLRQHIVDFAKQFLGCRYRYGGSDPRTGVDCSGFVRYVMQNAAGIAMLRSSGTQATQGRAIGADQMRPGDLVFYSQGGGINHVAIYAGDGQIVHASTYKTGVKMSPWNYRQPVRIVNMLGD